MTKLFAVALALAVHAAGPADKPQAKTPEALDRAAEERVVALERCVDDLEYFRRDLKDKKASLDKEFKGQVPDSFTYLLNLKTNRVAKQQVACSKLANGADQPLDAALASAREMDGSTAAYGARKKRLDALRERLNKALKRYMAD